MFSTPREIGLGRLALGTAELRNAYDKQRYLRALEAVDEAPCFRYHHTLERIAFDIRALHAFVCLEPV